MDISVICHRLGIFFAQQGRYSAAVAWQQKALAIGEKVAGKNHSCIAGVYHHIGVSYCG